MVIIDSLEVPVKFKLDKDRYEYARFSEQEYQSRYTRTREFMKRRGLDCLLIAGSHAIWDRGFINVRYLTNHMGTMEMNTYLVFPLKDDPTLYMLTLNSLQPDRVARAVIKDVRPYFNLKFDMGMILSKRLKELGLENKRIGIVEF